jgi:hypothetical protein
MPLSSGKGDRYAEEKPTSDTVQRLVEGAWSSLGPRLGQPGVLTGMLVVLLLVVVVWQHPLAKALGTEKVVPTLNPATPATVSAAPPNLPVRTHPRGWHKLPHTTPRDPFKALLAASAATSTGTTQSASAATGSAATGTGTGAGTGTGTGSGGSTQGSGSHGGHAGSTSPSGRCFATHVVAPGESLWSISNDRLLSHGFSSVNKAWHALYAANRSTIGSDPSYLLVGEKLCLPKA